MTNYPKYLLEGVIAEDGDFTIPPLQQRKKGDGSLSIKKGFGPETSKPLTDGGIPPSRMDFNGAFYLLSQFLRWYQQGGIMAYSTGLDYELGNEITFNGQKWRCVKANGKSSKLVTPGTDKSYWIKAEGGRIAGEVVAFHNARLGGSDGRRLIPWGETQADESFVFCDGGSDGRGGKVPNLINKCIIGSNPQNAGKTKEGASVSNFSLPVGAVILMAGSIVGDSSNYVPLKYAVELPKADYPDAFNSLGTKWGNASSGAKFKTPALAGRFPRFSGKTSGAEDSLGYLGDAGLPNITGYHGADDRMGYDVGGAFYNAGGSNTGSQGSEWGWRCYFDASRSNRIYGKSDTVTPENAVLDAYLLAKSGAASSEADRKTEATYSLAYFVKLPD